MRRFRTPIIAAIACALSACAASDDRGAAPWTGTMDTLPSGHVVVRNTATPIWPAGRGWKVVEELRIGSMEGDGPDVFGWIPSFEVDAAGRLWVLDGQAQELRVFSPTGAHVRTIGRKGGGPGEFAQAIHVDQGPDGLIRVMDPSNNRLSVFDTAGVYLGSKPALGGFIVIPWPGGYDHAGRYYTPVMSSGEFAVARLDTTFAVIDTLFPPRDPVRREFFEHRSGNNSFMRASIPFRGGMLWRLSRRGTIWAMFTDEYRLFELSADGDTIRTITREYTPLPVTAADRERAREELEWFTRQGGTIDLSKLPRTKPAATDFFTDDEGYVWVNRVTAAGPEGTEYDIFDPEGRFLGTVELPFPLSSVPAPIIRGGVLYGVMQDELEVQYLVRARIVKP